MTIREQLQELKLQIKKAIARAPIDDKLLSNLHAQSKSLKDVEKSFQLKGIPTLLLFHLFVQFYSYILVSNFQYVGIYRVIFFLSFWFYFFGPVNVIFSVFFFAANKSGLILVSSLRCSLFLLQLHCNLDSSRGKNASNYDCSPLDFTHLL